MSLFPEFLQRWLVTEPSAADDPTIFPLLPGQTLLSGKAQIWSTRVATSASGRERRQSNWSYPRWRIRAKYDVLRDRPSQPELQRLHGFFGAHLGQGTEFGFYDPYDHRVDGTLIGMGDGTTTTFQLSRVHGVGALSFREPIRRTVTRTIVVGRDEVTNYTIDDGGLVNLTTPPDPGVGVYWAGTFLFVCRFTSDELDPEQMTRDLWSLDSGVELLTVKR